MNIKIDEKNSGQRLDKFLTNANILKISRNQIQKLIEKNLIKINGLESSSHYSLKPNDVINIVENISEEKKEIKKNFAQTQKYKIKIVEETDEFLVINKPAGIAVHGAPDYTLVNWLIRKYPDIKKIGDDPERPGIVHRLDKDVSGLMVIAKTQNSFDNLKQQFQKRQIKKEYTALVYGKIIKDNSTINFPIKRSKDGYKMAAIPATTKGKPTENARLAETEFNVLKKFINYTLLKIKIKTGRTHQIRVHLAAYDHPIVGDNIYGTAKTRIQNKKLNLKRIFLIADRLSFLDLKNIKKNYKINLNQDLKNILKIVK